MTQIRHELDPWYSQHVPWNTFVDLATYDDTDVMWDAIGEAQEHYKPLYGKLKRAIKLLTPMQRKVVRLYAQGYRVDQIAKQIKNSYHNTYVCLWGNYRYKDSKGNKLNPPKRTYGAVGRLRKILEGNGVGK